MIKIKNNHINLFFIIPAIIHFCAVLFFTSKYDFNFSEEQKIIFFFTKIISFVLIIFLWQVIPFIYNSFTKKNIKAIEFIKYSFLYFFINILFLVIIYPTATNHIDIIREYNEIQQYKFDGWQHITTGIDFLVLYNIIPILWGIIVGNIFIFSLIFSYCITNIKEKISEKFYKLSMIPFFIPMFIVFNQIPRRNILGCWLFLFIFLYILFNKSSSSNKVFPSILFGILSGIFITSRFEFLPMLIFLPIIVLLFKLFTTKKYLLYLLSMIFSFTSIAYLQEKTVDNSTYQLDNLTFVYWNIKANNIEYKDLENDINTLKKVFPKLDESEMPNFGINNPTKEDIKNTIICLKRMLIKNYMLLVSINKKKLNNKINSNDFLQIQHSKISDNYPIEEYNSLEKSYFEHSQKEKLTSVFLYGNYDYKSIKLFNPFYNLFLSYVFILLMIVIGFVKKKFIYPIFSFMWLIILSIIFSVGMFAQYIYFYAFLFNTWIMFFIFVAELFEDKFKNKNHSICTNV